MPFQEIRIQETSDQIPIGAIPKSFSVIAKGELVRKCAPGDIVTVEGILESEQSENYRGQQHMLHVYY